MTSNRILGSQAHRMLNISPLHYVLESTCVSTATLSLSDSHQSIHGPNKRMGTNSIHSVSTLAKRTSLEVPRYIRSRKIQLIKDNKIRPYHAYHPSGLPSRNPLGDKTDDPGTGIRTWPTVIPVKTLRKIELFVPRFLCGWLASSRQTQTPRKMERTSRGQSEYI